MLKCIFISPTEKNTDEHIVSLRYRSALGEGLLLSGHQPIIMSLQDNSQIIIEKEKGGLAFTLGVGNYLKFKDNEALIISQKISAPEHCLI